MLYAALAFLVVVHMLFVLYAILGGFLVRKWRRTALVHLPVLVWAVAIEIVGGTCPLTPLENHLRARAGSAPYGGDFLERTLLPVLYPDPLTRPLQIVLGAGLLALNLIAYWPLLRSVFQTKRAGADGRR